MSEEMIVRHCSPTLAGIKTANLFSCYCESPEQLRSELRSMNRLLTRKGLRFLPLKVVGNKALIYVYRPARLQADLSRADAGVLLSKCGYTCAHPERCILHLMNRLHAQEDFPHEIGLFLGYPPEDVRGFIENDAKNFKFTGHWKVYGDEFAARTLFDRYKKCTSEYLQHLNIGRSLDQLAVAI